MNFIRCSFPSENDGWVSWSSWVAACASCGLEMDCNETWSGGADSGPIEPGGFDRQDECWYCNACLLGVELERERQEMIKQAKRDRSLLGRIKLFLRRITIKCREEGE